MDRRVLAAAQDRLSRWREAVRLDTGLNADEVLAQMRAALALDLDAPTALAAVDAWAGASTAIDSDDTDAPALVARVCDALLGVDPPEHKSGCTMVERRVDKTRACSGVGVIPNRR